MGNIPINEGSPELPNDMTWAELVHFLAEDDSIDHRPVDYEALAIGFKELLDGHEYLSAAQQHAEAQAGERRVQADIDRAHRQRRHYDDKAARDK